MEFYDLEILRLHDLLEMPPLNRSIVKSKNRKIV